jgi:hypothetical protein
VRARCKPTSRVSKLFHGPNEERRRRGRKLGGTLAASISIGQIKKYERERGGGRVARLTRVRRRIRSRSKLHRPQSGGILIRISSQQIIASRRRLPTSLGSRGSAPEFQLPPLALARSLGPAISHGRLPSCTHARRTDAGLRHATSFCTNILPLGPFLEFTISLYRYQCREFQQ